METGESGSVYETNKFQLKPLIGMKKELDIGKKSNAEKQKSNRRILSKVTKLTFKPKPKLITPKNQSKTTQITTKKYTGIQPVTIKSRSTLISHESTYCIKNIPKKTPTKRQSAENASRQQRNNSITKQSFVQPTKSNPKQQHHLEVKSDIWNTPMKSQILQEITSAVVNQSISSVKESILQSRGNSVDASVSNVHRKSIENSTKFKLKESIALPNTKEEKSPASREEIKRRLSVLQKNSLKIVENNVQKTKKKFSNVGVIQKTTKPDSPAQKLKSTPIKPQKNRKSSHTPVTPSKFVPTVKTNKNRIGILRRPEGISPTLNLTIQNQSALVQTSTTEKANKFLHKRTPQAAIAINSSESLELLKTSLKVPEVMNPNENLNCSLSQFNLEENEKNYGNAAAGADVNAIDDKNDSIPFWLRPTPVQPYPYNFILAVRKKLESITDPMLRTKGTKTAATQKSSPPTAETFSDLLSKVPICTNQQLKQQQTIESITNNNNSSAMIIQPSVEPISQAPINSINVSNQIKSPLKVQLYSINNSNVSKKNVSRHIELKSNQMEMTNGSGSQDTLSISSGILTSHSNVDKSREQQRPITPLATDAIDGMTIVKRNAKQSSASERESVKNQSHISSHINFERGNSFDDCSQLTFNDLNNASITTNSNESGSGSQGQNNDVQKLLKDFNESLSKVIKVNQYLHGILSHSFTSRKDKTPNSAKESTKYSNDFEEVITTERSSIEENVENEKNKGNIERVKQVGDIGYSNSNNETNSNIRTLFDQTTNRSSIGTELDNGTHNGNDISSKIAKEENGSRSDSHTNNDLKSISLSIAKKSIATEDDTNATESFQKHIFIEPEMLNQSIGSDIFIMFNKTSMGLKDELNSSTWSMQSLSYSSLGVCDKLLKSEVRKSQDLASLLKIRERALIDRFKGQIAWLELHKQKFKKARRIAEISMIKKKQRALLLRLNHDRKELHRIIKERQQDSHNTPINELNVNYNISHMSTNMSIRRKSLSQQQLKNTSSKKALKALELPGGGTALEFILQRRENELRHRREHVEKLLNWHQRLDIEEQQVIELEQMLMFVSSTDAYQPSPSSMHEYEQDSEDPHRSIALVSQHNKQKSRSNENSQLSTTQLNDLSLDKSRIEHIKQKQINKIEKSLNTLKSISIPSDGSDTDIKDNVAEILGCQLNKLWRRLTGQCIEEYQPNRVYRLTKPDLESLYERAKSAVLSQFDSNDEFKKRLIDGSMSIIEVEDTGGKEQYKCNGFDVEINETKTVVPELNLTSSPEQQSINPKANTEMDEGYYFSNNESVEKCQCESRSGIDNKDNALNDTHGSEDQQSDITEDSLNQDNDNESVSKSIESQENIRTETIKNSKKVNANPMGKSSAIATFNLNVSQNDFQLIEDTSFPNIDVQLTLSANNSSSSLVLPEEISSAVNTVQSPDNDYLYQSEKFEMVPSTEIVETNDSSKIDEQITMESNNSLKSASYTNGKFSESYDESIRSERSIHDQQSIELSFIEEKTAKTSEENDGSKPSTNVQTENSSDNTLKNNDLESAKCESDLSCTKRQYQYSLSNSSIDHNKELQADALKRTSVPISNDAEPKSPDQSTVSYLKLDNPFLREIPNKPPPPYPAHRQLPTMPPFPSNGRIKEIVYERIEQLYREAKIKIVPQSPMMSSPNLTDNTNTSTNSNAISSPATPHPSDATFVCSPSILSSSLTPTISNVYESIIHDCCGEIIEDIKNDANAFRQPLAFYNPPNRLLCYQKYALKRIFKLLNRPNDGRQDDCRSSTLLLPRVARLSSSNRRKRDTVDEILIQELYEDETKWTNPPILEESEIVQSVGNDLTKLLVDESSEIHDQSNNTINGEEL